MTEIAMRIDAAGSGGRNTINRVTIGWTMLVLILSAMVLRDGVGPSPFPWPLAWMFLLPSLLVAAFNPKTAIQLQIGIAMTGLGAMVASMHFGVDALILEKFVPVTIAVLLVALFQVCGAFRVAFRQSAH